LKSPSGHLPAFGEREDARWGWGADLLEGDRWLVRQVHGLTEQLADERGDEVVLLLGDEADRDQQCAVAERDEGGTAVGEVPPGVHAVDLRLDLVFEQVKAEFGPRLDHLEGIGARSCRRAHLADGVGDVTGLVFAPSADQANERLGVVVELLELARLDERNGEAEALDRVADLAEADPELDRVLDLGDQVGELDGGAVGAGILVDGREHADVQRCADGQGTGHGYSRGAIHRFLNRTINRHLYVSCAQRIDTATTVGGIRNYVRVIKNIHLCSVGFGQDFLVRCNQDDLES
jgi:hypothetical protein